MATTFTLISSVTVGSGGAGNIEFTSIPATYTDLQILISGRGSSTSAETSLTVQFNSSTSGYSSRNLRGSGSAVSSLTNVYGTTEIYIGEIPANASTSNTFGNAAIYIPNYTASNNKAVSVDMVSENNATSAWTYLSAGLWSNLSAITSVKILQQGTSNFVQYSTAYLYGISNA